MPPAEHKNGGFEFQNRRMGKIFEHGKGPAQQRFFSFLPLGRWDVILININIKIYMSLTVMSV